MIINPLDNVSVNPENGHKYAVVAIKKGDAVIKYGNRIGYATEDIAEGGLVHSHNLKTALSGKEDYGYNPVFAVREAGVPAFFEGYVRPDGKVGVRNEIWIIPTVGCVNKVAEKLASLTGAFAFTHPFGCSQLGGDHETTQKILAGLVNHPNAGGVLVLSLGCENNNLSEFKKALGDVDGRRVRFLCAQESEDEIADGVAIINELRAYADTFKRQKVSADRLVIGLKCGGSDGLSGITANPLVGRFCDNLVSKGGSCVLTEVPEMFGAEHLLFARCRDRETFEKAVAMVNGFKDYFIRYGQPIYENPSPGNREGGITTLEEKSLGCVQKGGMSEITDVLGYGDTVGKSGLSLLTGPGNDMVAITNLTAAGAHIILFTTGRGTPLGAPVPTVKISTNEALFTKKPAWIDFDASPVLTGADLDKEFFSYVLDVASGTLTKNEQNGYREISIFKDGVTL